MVSAKTIGDGPIVNWYVEAWQIPVGFIGKCCLVLAINFQIFFHFFLLTFCDVLFNF